MNGDLTKQFGRTASRGAIIFPSATPAFGKVLREMKRFSKIRSPRAPQG
jgi:hypothetical protein